MGKRLWALVKKEFIQLKRDRRTLAMLIILPVLWLVAFGYAVNFDIEELRVAWIDEADNESSRKLWDHLQKNEHFQLIGTNWSRNLAKEAMEDGEIDAAVIIPKNYEWLSAKSKPLVWVDGSELFSSQSFVRYFQEAWGDVQQDHFEAVKSDVWETMTETGGSMEVDVGQLPQFQELTREIPAEQLPHFHESLKRGLQEQIQDNLDNRIEQVMETFPDLSEVQPEVDILYNPDMKTVHFMIPGLVGLVLIFITTLMTALGIVKEKERGTLEQLAVSPLSSFELMLGKVLPYVLIALVDFLVVFAIGVWWFDVPFKGDVLPFFAVSLAFLVCSLGIGLLVSTVSETQQQAMQLAIFTLVPQFILSGFVFPLEAIPWGIRWISYLMPLTYYVPISRGVFLKGTEMAAFVQPALILTGLAVFVILIASLRFRRKLG